MCLQCRKPNSDGKSLLQSKDLLQGTKQGSGRQVLDPVQLGLCDWGSYKGGEQRG